MLASTLIEAAHTVHGAEAGPYQPHHMRSKGLALAAVALVGLAARTEGGSAMVEPGAVTITKTYPLHNECWGGYDANVKHAFAQYNFHIPVPVLPDIPANVNSTLTVLERQQLCSRTGKLSIAVTTYKGHKSYKASIPEQGLVLQQWEPDQTQNPTHNGSTTGKLVHLDGEVLSILPLVQDYVPKDDNSLWALPDSLVRIQARISAAQCQDQAWVKGDLRQKFESAAASDLASIISQVDSAVVKPTDIQVTAPAHIDVRVDAQNRMETIRHQLQKVDVSLPAVAPPTCHVIAPQQPPAGK